MSINIIAKSVKGKEYLICDMMATRLTREKWEAVKASNPEVFGDTDKYTWRFIPQNETDFSWWYRISRKLTSQKIVTACFECDYHGKVREV